MHIKKTKHIPSVFFDEVDVGIGGATAEVVGRLLASLASRSQVLCITHLPQIAAFADTPAGEKFAAIASLSVIRISLRPRLWANSQAAMVSRE